jgi:hypothetical protein
MSNLTSDRMANPVTFKNCSVILAASVKATKGGVACIDTSAGVWKPMVSGNANLVRLGLWTETNDNTGSTATTRVMVSLDQEIYGQWLQNATGGSAVTTANLYKAVYAVDDHTVGNAAIGGGSSMGTAFDLDAILGVAVVKIISP